MWRSTARASAGALGPSWRVLLVVAGLAAYALASHWLMLHAADRLWAVGALCGPLVLMLLGYAWKRRDGHALLACALLLSLLALAVARGGASGVNRLYVLQHAGIHLALAWVFGSTLRQGSAALISVMAERVHGCITPAMRAYTRRLTMVWVGYFVTVAALSLALFVWAPWSWWSLFGNVLTPLSLVLMFVLEHGVRRLLHPEFERTTITQVVQAYRRAFAHDKAAP